MGAAIQPTEASPAVPWREELPRQYPDGAIPLADIAGRYLGMSLRRAADHARDNKLPFPCFRMGTRRSPLMVRVDDFVAYLDQRADEARDAWEKVNGEGGQ